MPKPTTRHARREQQRDMGKAIKRAKRKIAAAKRIVATTPLPMQQQYQHFLTVHGRLPNLIVGISQQDEDASDTGKVVKALSSILNVPYRLATACDSLSEALPSPTERVMFVVLSEASLPKRSELLTPEWVGRVEVYADALCPVRWYPEVTP
jgi:hypothetical protein